MEVTYEAVIVSQAVDICGLRQDLVAALRRIDELEAGLAELRNREVAGAASDVDRRDA